ncbi:TPA: transcription factor [Sulfurisphaera tokodaii]|uniref:Transcription factor n=1 Tax=Sulfurisphaera tokodaii TaxID=111955 RepID=A0A832TGF5_9CREN|nr:transcription factor [Sulfurisphaera tokodaii]
MDAKEWKDAIENDLRREDLPESYKETLREVLRLIENGEIEIAEEIAINLPILE